MSLVTDPNTVQASHFVSALREQLREMTPKLVRAERELARGHAGRARTMRVEAAELRADIGLAQSLIDRLHRRFPGLDVAAGPTRQASAPVNGAPGGEPDVKVCGGHCHVNWNV
jgi:DNA-binding transcriptional LysR family regulator